MVLGWSWADPLAALVIAEGIEAWRGETCECGLHSRLAEVAMSRLRAAPRPAAAHRKRVTTVLRREWRGPVAQAVEALTRHAP